MCCGNKIRPAFRRAQPLPPPTMAATAAGPAFEYIGRSGLTVVSPLTGTRYRFNGPGARLRVDPRDGQALAGIAALRQVK